MTDAREVIAKHLRWYALKDDVAEREADIIIAALSAAGLVIVPKVCTEKMAEAYDNIDFIRQGTLVYSVYDQGEEVWRVMVEAASDE